MTSLYFDILKFKFLETKTSHMLTAQPSTCDLFALIEIYGRKVQSVYNTLEKINKKDFNNTNMTCKQST